EWQQAVEQWIPEIVNPVNAIQSNFNQMVSSGSDAIGAFFKGNLRETFEGLNGAMQAGVGIVDSIGGYIQLVLVAVPSLIGSIWPGPGTGAGASLGQSLNTIISGFIRTIQVGTEFVQQAFKALDL